MARHARRAHVYSINGERLRSIPEREAYSMVESGQARRMSRPKAPQLVIRLLQSRTGSPMVESTITLGEMEANAFGAAGIVECRRGGFVDRAMAKIEIWPLVGDDRAVRVGPRVAPSYI